MEGMGLIAKKCRICKGQEVLVDAGLNEATGKFTRQFQCENDHKGMVEKAAVDKAYQLKAIQELNQLVGEIEATTSEKGG